MYICESQLEPPPPLLKGGGYDLPKIESLMRVQNVLLERGINLKRGGGVGVEMQGLPLFYYFTVQSNLLCVRGKQGSLYYFLDLQYFELVMQDSRSSLYCTKTRYHLYILIHFGSLQKMLTA